MSIRVVVADDHPVMLLGLVRVLRGHPDIVVVAQASDGAEALVRIAADRPDVALVDHHMPRVSGSEVARRAARDYPCVRVIVCTAADREVRDSIASTPGVYEVLSKELTPSEMCAAVVRAAEALL